MCQTIRRSRQPGDRRDRTDPRLGRADKLKRIKEQLRRLRFPRLAALEDSLARKHQALKLPAEIRLTVPPGLEGGRLRSSLRGPTKPELKRLSATTATDAGRESSARSARAFDCWWHDCSPDNPSKER